MPPRREVPYAHIRVVPRKDSPKVPTPVLPSNAAYNKPSFAAELNTTEPGSLASLPGKAGSLASHDTKASFAATARAAELSAARTRGGLDSQLALRHGTETAADHGEMPKKSGWTKSKHAWKRLNLSDLSDSGSTQKGPLSGRSESDTFEGGIEGGVEDGVEGGVEAADNRQSSTAASSQYDETQQLSSTQPNMGRIVPKVESSVPGPGGQPLATVDPSAKPKSTSFDQYKPGAATEAGYVASIVQSNSQGTSKPTCSGTDRHARVPHPDNRKRSYLRVAVPHKQPNRGGSRYMGSMTPDKSASECSRSSLQLVSSMSSVGSHSPPKRTLGPLPGLPSPPRRALGPPPGLIHPQLQARPPEFYPAVKGTTGELAKQEPYTPPPICNPSTQPCIGPPSGIPDEPNNLPNGELRSTIPLETQTSNRGKLPNTHYQPLAHHNRIQHPAQRRAAATAEYQNRSSASPATSSHEATTPTKSQQSTPQSQQPKTSYYHPSKPSPLHSADSSSLHASYSSPVTCSTPPPFDIAAAQRLARREWDAIKAAASADWRASNFSDDATTLGTPNAPTAGGLLDVAGEVMIELMAPTLLQLSRYVRGHVNYRADYLHRMTARPAWAVDHGPDGNQSFFGGDWGTPPRRLARDARYSRSEY